MDTWGMGFALSIPKSKSPNRKMILEWNVTLGVHDIMTSTLSHPKADRNQLKCGYKRQECET
jgi:hypothetical protein